MVAQNRESGLSLSFARQFNRSKPPVDDDTTHHSSLFFNQGRDLLHSGDSNGVKFFDLAAELDPLNAELLHNQADEIFVYATQIQSRKMLLLAAKKYKKCTALDPTYLPAWLRWGKTLYQLGKIDNEAHYFNEAKVKLERALSLVEEEHAEFLQELYWCHGKVMLEIAVSSQEVSDLNHALESFIKGENLPDKHPADFWVDFGGVYHRLGQQINDARLLTKAIECFKKGVQRQERHFKAWYQMGKTLSRLYEWTLDEDHFSASNECFTSAAQLYPVNAELWIDWAGMLKESGKRLCDIKRLQSAVEKCHRAHACSPDNIIAIAIWAEALSTLGVLTERLELLQEAENKIREALDIHEPSPEIYYAWGTCLYSYGIYFEDLDYYYQAIEKFQEGLSTDRSYHRLWYALGITYAQAAELESDPSILNRACKFFSRAISLHSCSSYYYEYALALSKIGEINRDQKMIELSIVHFEHALSFQKNAIYLHPEWLYQYAITLDTLADYTDNPNHYIKAIEILAHVLIVDPEHPEVNYRLALAYSHYGELSSETEIYLQAINHYKLAHKKDPENDLIILDWALTLVNMSQISANRYEREHLTQEAEYKMIQAAKLGNTLAYYHLACLYSIICNYEKSVQFLLKAHSFNALPPLDEIIQDSWLENLRDTELFSHFITQIEPPQLAADA